MTKKGLSSLALLLIFLSALPVLAHGGENHAGKAFESAEPGLKKEAITLTPDLQKAIGLKVVPVRSRLVSPSLGTTGQIEALPERTIDVSAPLAGRLVQVNVRQGQAVKAGQLLAVLDSAELRQLNVTARQQESQIRAEITRLQAQKDLAQSNLRREQQLFKIQISAAREVEIAQATFLAAQADLKAAQEQLRLVRAPLVARLAQLGSAGTTNGLVDLKAPRDGYLVAQEAATGEQVEAGRILYKVVNLDPVWVVADLYEKDLARVQLDLPVVVTSPTFPNKIFRGKISTLDALVDAEARTLKIRAVVPNQNQRLKPGMFVSVNVETGIPTPALTIPQTAILQSNGEKLVYVKNGDQFEATPVQLGAEIGDEVIVSDGLFEGDEVVVERAFQLQAQALKGSPDSPQSAEGKAEASPIPPAKPAPEFPSLWVWSLGSLALVGFGFTGGLVVARRQMAGSMAKDLAPMHREGKVPLRKES